MLKAIIIDDEVHCIDRLESLLKTHLFADVTLLASCATSEEAKTAISSLNPDLVFLDIELGETNAFEFLNSLPSTPFHIIFTTAFEKYAVKAFKFSGAADYLLKPIDLDELKSAVSKVKNDQQHTNNTEMLAMLRQNFLLTKGESKIITIPTINGLSFLNVQDIIRCKSDVNYTTIYLNDKTSIMVAKTLKEFENLLSESGFFRVHNSHLVSLKYIKNYNKGKGGYITLKDNTEIEVSTRRKDEFFKWLSTV